MELRRKVREESEEVLYVFCDQALGPWVPYLAQRPHIVHCHDLLALRSALGEFPENRTKLPGRIYQRYIRQGFQSARHFISVSEHSREELHRVGNVSALTSEVVYNGLNPLYQPAERAGAILHLQESRILDGDVQFLLHVGADNWYKNRLGLFLLYAAYAASVEKPLPLLIIGPPPVAREVCQTLDVARSKGQVYFFENIDGESLRSAYSAASAFLFPSLAEGFGWPIAEALACGCPVITTDEPPMNEVGGSVPYYLPRMHLTNRDEWARNAAKVLECVLSSSSIAKSERSSRGIDWVRRFSLTAAIDAYEKIYLRVFEYERRRGKPMFHVLGSGRSNSHRSLH